MHHTITVIIFMN